MHKALLNARTSVEPYQGLDVADQEKQDGEPPMRTYRGLIIYEKKKCFLCPGVSYAPAFTVVIVNREKCQKTLIKRKTPAVDPSSDDPD
jgi:hypothetical protein